MNQMFERKQVARPVEIPDQTPFNPFGIKSEKQAVNSFLNVFDDTFNKNRDHRGEVGYREELERLILEMDDRVKEELHSLTNAYQQNLIRIMDSAIDADAQPREPISGDMAEFSSNPHFAAEIAYRKESKEQSLREELESLERKYANDMKFLKDRYVRLRFVMVSYL